MAINILMPALSPTMTEGTVARWLKKEGDMVQSGDVIAEIETDKATMEVEAADEGILGKILIPEGTEHVAVKTPIAILVDEGEDVPEAPAAGTKPEPEKKAGVKDETPAPIEISSFDPDKKPAAPGKGKGERIFISPLARRIAKEHGVDIASLAGTGPNGRILRRDVEKAKGQKPAPAASSAAAPAAGHVEHVKHSGMRKVIVRRLTESKTQVPHFYVSVDIELDALLSLRSRLNKALEAEGCKISVNDMMIKAVALALKKLPGLNVQFTETEMLHFEDVDISMAVSVPEGLVTPVIRQADRKSLREISQEARSLATRARDGKLSPEDYQGGTFSISNMGMFGVKDFAAIINPPQAAILAVASGEKRPVVRDGELAVATVMTATLSVDHRARSEERRVGKEC